MHPVYTGMLPQTYASIHPHKHTQSHTEQQPHCHTHTHGHTHTNTHAHSHTHVHSKSLLSLSGCSSASHPRASRLALGAALGHCRAGAPTCHGRGLPAAEAALARAQPPLLTGAVQFWTRCEGTFYFPILEKSQGSRASVASSPALGHLRTPEEAGGLPSASLSDKEISREWEREEGLREALGSWGHASYLSAGSVACPSCNHQHLSPSLLQNSFCAGSLLPVLAPICSHSAARALSQAPS